MSYKERETTWRPIMSEYLAPVESFERDCDVIGGTRGAYYADTRRNYYRDVQGAFYGALLRVGILQGVYRNAYKGWRALIIVVPPSPRASPPRSSPTRCPTQLTEALSAWDANSEQQHHSSEGFTVSPGYTLKRT